METLIHHCMPGKGCLIMVPVGTPWEKSSAHEFRETLCYILLINGLLHTISSSWCIKLTSTQKHLAFKHECAIQMERNWKASIMFKKKKKLWLWTYIFHTCSLAKLDSWISWIIHKYYNIGCLRFHGIKLDVDTAVAITIPWWDELMKYSGIWIVFKSSNVI